MTNIKLSVVDKATKTILIVDDDTDSIDALKTTLNNLGTIICVTEYQKAIDKITKKGNKKIDLAVIDLMLTPKTEEDGFNIVKIISPSTPVIIVSFIYNADTIAKAQRFFNVRYYFRRSFVHEDFKSAAEDCLNGTATGFTLV